MRKTQSFYRKNAVNKSVPFLEERETRFFSIKQKKNLIFSLGEKNLAVPFFDKRGGNRHFPLANESNFNPVFFLRRWRISPFSFSEYKEDFVSLFQGEHPFIFLRKVTKIVLFFPSMRRILFFLFEERKVAIFFRI